MRAIKFIGKPIQMTLPNDEHLQSYIDEAVYRWNTREAYQSKCFSDMFNKSIGLIVTWSELKLCKVS